MSHSKRTIAGAIVAGTIAVCGVAVGTHLTGRSPSGVGRGGTSSVDHRGETHHGLSASSFPNATSTGWQHTGTTLTPYAGPSTIARDGTVIAGMDVRSCLFITANNVTIRNSRIRCAAASPADPGVMVVQQSDSYHPDVSGLTMTDVEIERPPGSRGGADYAVQLYGSNVTLTRVKIHNVTSGVHISGRAVTLQDSFIGGLVDISGRDHVDGVISNGGSSDVTLRHNTIDVPLAQTTPIALFPELGSNSHWRIQDNLLNGGGYCIYPGYTAGRERPNTNIVVSANAFGAKYFPRCGRNGPVAPSSGGRFSDGVGNVWTDNRWQNDGSPVGPDG